MRYPVLFRWQGSLLGSSLGGVLTQRENSVATWQKVQEEGIQCLATTGEWEPLYSQGEISASELLLQHLPLLLFFHDQPQVLREQILAIATQQNYSPEKMSAIMAYATVTSWILTEQLYGKTLFRNLLATAADGESNDKILQTLQTSLEKGATLQEIKNQLPPTCQDIWLALYCFATTVEDLVFTVHRGQTMASVSPFVLPLVGALSGGQNSISAIPIPWRCWLRKQKQEWDNTLERMFATWSGSYEFAKINQPLKQSAIATSQVIQPRKGDYDQTIYSESSTDLT